MSSICFISNQTKTDFFELLADELASKGVDVFWIAVNKRISDNLISKYGKERVLYLPLTIDSIGKIFELKINDLLLADRRLKNVPQQGVSYLINIQLHIYKFLTENLIKRIVGEQTYAYECVIFRIVKYFVPECQWLSPYPSRYPSGHFSFYCDESFSREIFESSKSNACSLDIMNNNIEPKNGQDYKRAIKLYIKESKTFKLKLEKIIRFFSAKNYDSEDPTWKSNTRLDKFKKNMTYFINIFMYRFVGKVGLDDLNNVIGQKIVFPLHLQPELNIDTAGRYFDNQKQTIIDIWRQLGPNDVLYIKEHPIAIGNRSYSFFNSLTFWPNIRVLSEKVDVNDLLKCVDYVFTISGTMGMEAALMGNKVFCLAPTTYNRLSTVATPNIEDFRNAKNIDDLYNNSLNKEIKWSLKEYKQHMENFSFIGDAEGDITGNPEARNSMNIKLVANALLSTF